LEKKNTRIPKCTELLAADMMNLHSTQTGECMDSHDSIH